MASLCLFVHYMVWMTMVVSFMLCAASWMVAVQAVRTGDAKTMLAVFNTRFAFYHLMTGFSICYLLVFA